MNETAFGEGLVVRGTHYLFGGKVKNADEFVLKEKELALKLALYPWILGTVFNPTDLENEFTSSVSIHLFFILLREIQLNQVNYQQIHVHESSTRTFFFQNCMYFVVFGTYQIITTKCAHSHLGTVERRYSSTKIGTHLRSR